MTTLNSSEAVVATENGANEVRMTLNPELYAPRDLIFQAAYVFTDKAYVELDLDEAGRVVAILRGKKALNKSQLGALRGEFANELVHQGLRLKLARDNQKLRELIAAKALFAAARGEELGEMRQSLLTRAEAQTPRPWSDATPEEQAELDALLNEIEQEFAADPTAIAIPWDEKQSPPVAPAAEQDKGKERPGE